MSNSPDQNFLLGKIEATTSGIAEDVRAIRSEVGTLASRMGAAEQRLSEIEGERAYIVPQYNTWRASISNEVQNLLAWKHEHEGTMKGAGWMGKLAWTGFAALMGVLMFAAGLYFKAPVSAPAQPAPAHQTTKG